jgi:Protein of unknown function (DUF3363)
LIASSLGVSPWYSARQASAKRSGRQWTARIEHLIGEGLAQRQAQRVVFARDLLDTLRRRELEEAEARISLNTGLPYRPVEDSETIAGVYRQRLDLAAGRFAMIDDSLGFQSRALDTITRTASWP